jgi:Mg2+ and Co2+ transporter CorA
VFLAALRPAAGLFDMNVGGIPGSDGSHACQRSSALFIGLGAFVYFWGRRRID